MQLALLVPFAFAATLAPQDRDVARLTRQALERDPVESRAAIEQLGAFGKAALKEMR